MAFAEPLTFDELLERELLSVVFQPIVEVWTGRLLGYEALARCPAGPWSGPIELYRAATAAGRVGELGRLYRRTAERGCPTGALFLNLFPNEFDYGWLVRPDDPVFRRKQPVYLEITESVPLEFFNQCHAVLAEVREKGVLLAVDDLGAGYSNLKYIADLAPDVVKIDRALISGVAIGSRQFRLLRSISELCKQMGAQVVAEGIETLSELEAARAAGVDFCQGYLIARPADPPPAPLWPPAAS